MYKRQIQELPKNYEKIWDEATTLGYKKDNLFHWYIKHWKERNPWIGLPSLLDILKVYIVDRGVKSKAKLVLQAASPRDWEDFIFTHSTDDLELRLLTKGDLMTRILKQNIDSTLTPIIKKNIESILINRLNASTDQANKKNIEFVIENFKKEGLL